MNKPAQGIGSPVPATLSLRLIDHHFVDLYLSTDPLSPPMVRGLRSRIQPGSAVSKGVARIPDHLQADVEILRETIDRKWRNTNFKREFTVAHDDCAYRCSLIAPPDGIFQVPEQFSELHVLRWCVRKLGDRIPNLSELGVNDVIRREVSDLMIHRGLVLVSGPFAAGKTTLASSMFDGWVRDTREVGVAFEDPPELPLARVSEDQGVIYQIDLMDRSIREAIKSSRRWSPRFVFLGEVRAADVCSELLHMAISGPLALCTIHASDPVQAIVSLFRFASGAMSEELARDMIAVSLRHVFHQELRSGRPILRAIRIHGPENHLIRSRIKSGNFSALYDDFDRQIAGRSTG